MIATTLGPAIIGSNPEFNVLLTATSVPEASAARLKINSDTGEILYRDEASNELKPARIAVNPQTRELIVFDGEQWVAIKTQGPGLTRLIDKAVRDNFNRENQKRISYLKGQLLSMNFWSLLLGPPAALGILIWLTSWIVAGFHLRQSN